MNWLLVWCKPQWRPYMYVPQLIWSLSAIKADISIVKLADYCLSLLPNLYWSTIDQLHVWINRWYPFIAELAERSPKLYKIEVTHQAKKTWMYDRTTVQPYNRTTVQGATFNMRGQLYRGHANPQLCPVVQWSVHWAPSRMTRVLVLARARHCALETCRKKKCELHF